jgi:long-chain acyl-CoA synthetase
MGHPRIRGWGLRPAILKWRRGYDGQVRAHLASLVDDFRRHGAETAVVAHRGNRRYPTSYGELAKLAGRFAAELERRGITPGERVVLWGENSAEWIAVFFGCLLRGVMVVPLDAAGSAEFAARVIEDVAPKLVVGDAGSLEALRSTFYVDRSEDQPATDQGTENEQRTTSNVPRMELAGIAEHLPAAPLFTVSDAVTLQTPFQIVFTSGTTAEPRGIVHTHRNVLVSLQTIESEIGRYIKYERIFHPLRFLHCIPLSHVFGQFMGLWCPALLAAEVHFADQLEPSRTVGLIRRERISVLIAVPRVLQLLRVHLLGVFPELKRSAAYVDRSSLRTPNDSRSTNHERRATKKAKTSNTAVTILRTWWRFRRVHSALGWKFWAVISGGATLPAELETFWNRLGFALIQGYGMTETAALVTLNHPFHIAAGTVGRPLPGREVKIADDGEVLVRGEMLSGATWQGGKMHEREGEWLATGDLAEKNAAGDLRFVGRKGDVIVTAAGLNIHPADLETALSGQPGIRGVGVVACDLANGPEPVAVVLFNGSDVELDQAVANANRTLADFQQIRRVLRWPELQFPYTSTGKLIRRQVAQWACETLAGRGSSGPLPAGPTDALLSLIGEVTGEPAPANAEPDLLRLSEDLHLDSLGRVQLQSALEQSFGVELEDDGLASAETVGELRSLIEAQVVSSKLAVGSSPSGEEQAAAASEERTTKNVERTSNQPSATAAEAHVYPHWPWSWPVWAMRVVFIELVMRPLVWLLAAPRVTYGPGARAALAGLQTEREERGAAKSGQPSPMILIANHVTEYDGALILYALPPRLRHHVAVAMSGEMLLDFRNARNQSNVFENLFGPVAYLLITALFNVFPLPRARGFRRSFAHAGEAMDRGYSILIFPEGTRSKDGKLGHFRPGIGLLAEESRAPIVPIGLAGLYELTATRHWFRSGKLEVRIGAPFPAAGDDTDPAQLTVALERVIRGLLAAPGETG